MKTEDELKAIKADLDGKFKPVFTITVPLNDDETEQATIFLKKFDRSILTAVQKLAGGADSLKATEVFLKNCFIGGDDLALVLENFDALRAIESVMIELVTAKKAVLKKN